MKKVLAVFSLYIFSAINIFSQEVPELITDRPDQTESAAIVTKGWLQVETGVSFEQTKVKGLFGDININDYSIAGTLLRYGLNNSFELRFGGGYFITESDLFSNNNGFGELFIGTKYLLPIKEINLAVLAHLGLPIGNDSYSPEKIEPEIILAAAQDLSENVSLGINFGGRWESVAEETSFFYATALGISLTDKLAAFVELYGNLTDELHKFDAGFTYLSSDHLQIDTSAGVNLNGENTNWFLSFGASFRIPKE